MIKYDALHNFISPVTGRIRCPENYILVGNEKGIATPDNILIELLDSSFILKDPNSKLPNAQSLSSLENGFMFNTEGVISTTNDLPLPNLEYKHIWIGDENNKAQVVNTIDIDNLPSLGSTNIPKPTGGFIGKVWEGTSSGRPEESSIVGEMFADIGILNAKFLSGKFVMNSGLTASFPKAQFLDALTAGALVKTSSAGDGKLESVVLAQDQVLMGGANNVPESRARIGVENLPLLAEGRLWRGGANSIPESVTTIDIINLPNLTNNRVWQGNAQGRPEEVELNFAPSDATYIIKQPNAKLINAQVLSELGVGIAKILEGGAFAIAIPDEDYATKETLEQIKAETEEFKNQAANSAEQAANSEELASISEELASISAEEATAAAASASTAAGAASISATTAEISATAAGASAIAAGSSAASASSSASDSAESASQSLEHLNQLLNTGINLVGDVLGGGPLKDPITLNFKENPIFTGAGSMTIPVGTTAQRPSNPALGMVRINTDF